MLWTPEDKRTLERDIYRWEDNIKVNHGQLGWKVWTGYILFTTGFGSQLLWRQQLNSDQISDY